VKSNHIAGEIYKRVVPAVTSRDIHAMHGAHSSRLREAVEFFNHKLIVLVELIAVNAVA
jgi:hypothetical protein